MSVAKWVWLVIAIVVVLLLVKQIPQARRYLRMKHM
jgi:Family of unknown function (DUF6893)